MKNIRLWNLISAAVTLVAGTLLHFIYDWFGGSIAAVFGAVNESTWEHLKLIFWPMVIMGIIEYFIYGKSLKSFIPIRVLSILIGMLTTVALFYTYSGILGFNFLIADILTFILGVLVAYCYSVKQFEKENTLLSKKTTNIFFIALLVVLIICFSVFSFFPPHIGLFLDPVTNSYGF